MTPDIIIDIFREALSIIILLVVVIIAPGLVTGFFIAVFQAATSINEQTLSFLPRLVVTLFTLSVIGSWFFGTIVDFYERLMVSIPTLIG
ncbi:MAG: flagellar biosynthetic protein FliQ [Gammaproteobacteria bacterium]|nr:flagellar biosynthetic protein FliQ [Gammaproteobacteria bacterium]NNJ72981.1 flagellar biosynthetic protein FliQ [Enterobacterales bacterium]